MDPMTSNTQYNYTKINTAQNSSELSCNPVVEHCHKIKKVGGHPKRKTYYTPKSNAINQTSCAEYVVSGSEIVSKKITHVPPPQFSLNNREHLESYLRLEDMQEREQSTRRSNFLYFLYDCCNACCGTTLRCDESLNYHTVPINSANR